MYQEDIQQHRTVVKACLLLDTHLKLAWQSKSFGDDPYSPNL